METSKSSLSNIAQRVQEELDVRHQDIVLSVYKFMLKKHNDPQCNCNYCIQLAPYIREKRQLQHFQRRVFNDNLSYSEDYSLAYAMESISRYKRRIKRMKLEKDSLKLI